MGDELVAVKGLDENLSATLREEWSPMPDVHVVLAWLPLEVADRHARLVHSQSVVRREAASLARRHAGVIVHVTTPGEVPRFRPDLQGWSVSLSHAWPVVACAIGRDALVGVDVETPRPGDDLASLRRAAFADGEILEVGTCEDGETLRRWTIKEAVLKAGRRGLTVDPRSVLTQRGDRLGAVPPGWGRSARWLVQSQWRRDVVVSVAVLPAADSPVGVSGVLP